VVEQSLPSGRRITTNAAGINNQGQVAGSFADQNGVIPRFKKILKVAPLPPSRVRGASLTAAAAINDRGQVVGKVTLSSSGAVAFLYSNNSTSDDMLTRFPLVPLPHPNCAGSSTRMVAPVEGVAEGCTRAVRQVAGFTCYGFTVTITTP
jgi:probable HAF family extracellular repeat protein